MKANKKLATSTICKNVIIKIFCGCSVTQQEIIHSKH